jgi:hypothetical protein
LPVLLLLASGSARADDGETDPETPTMIVQAALVELPTTPPCEGRKIQRVTTRYRVERVVRGPALKPGAALLVVHRCPEYARGPSRYGNGKAPPLRPGHRHLLRLGSLEADVTLIDRFAKSEGPRYRALRTDPAPEPPRIAVVFTGGAGAAQRLDFDTEQVTVGRAPDVDVLLADPAVAFRHLRLEVREGEAQVTARDLSGRGLRIDGKRWQGPRPITSQNKIVIGPYTLRVSLFTPEEIAE